MREQRLACVRLGEHDSRGVERTGDQIAYDVGELRARGDLAERGGHPVEQHEVLAGVARARVRRFDDLALPDLAGECTRDLRELRAHPIDLVGYDRALDLAVLIAHVMAVADAT